MKTEEQKKVAEYFINFNNGRGGKFCEIGSDGDMELSNTKKLFEQGWNGIIADGSVTSIAKLKQAYSNDSRIQFLQYPINGDGGFMEFEEPIEGSEQKIKSRVEAMSLQRFMSLWGNDIDFLNVNAKGDGINCLLISLIKGDFWHRLKAICIKHDGYSKYMIDMLSGYNFRLLLLNDENLIMVK